jgi:hypothetical protein
MNLLLHIVQAVLALMALGILLSFPKFRQAELLVVSLIYATSAAVSVAAGAWWPLVAGFVTAWILLAIVGDRSKPGHPQFNFTQFLTRTAREREQQEQRVNRAIRQAASDNRIVHLLNANGRTTDDLAAIRLELVNFGLGESASRIIVDPTLLEAYLALSSAPLPKGWTEVDRKLHIATIFRERLT